MNRRPRPRSLAAGLAALALAGVLTACGGSGDDVATDPTSTDDSTSATPSPSPSPTVGTYPAYPHQDYAYTLEMRCFCANVDQKYRITVEDGEVTQVTWATAGDGHEIGDAVSDEYLRITLQDIIDHANDTKAAKVEVDWPAGQDYPNSVYVDQQATMADEEMTWVVSDVEPAA